MLFSCFFFIYVFCLAYLYGYLVLRWLKIGCETTCEHLALTALFGLAVITTLGSIFSLFWRINWEFQLLLVLGGAGILMLLKPWRTWKPILEFKHLFSSLVLILGGLILLNASTLQPANPDTGIYHAQAIHWIESYPAIPGLANIHQRFGYNSSWLVTNAIFSLSFLGLQPFHLMTGFLLIVVCVYFFSGVKNLCAKKVEVSDLLKTGFLLSLFIFLLDQTSSPGTDAPATILVWVTQVECVKLFERKRKLSEQAFLPILILAAYSVTIKLSTTPILLLAIPIFLQSLKTKDFKRMGLVSSVLAALLIPFLARNLILSGYLIYPGPAIDLFQLDWRLPLESVSSERAIIHWFAALPNTRFDAFQQMSTQAWVTEWFLNLIPRHKALLGAVLITPLVFGLLPVLKSWRVFLKENQPMNGLLLIPSIGILFWFFSAPTFRFGYSFILGSVVLAFSLLGFFLARIIPSIKVPLSWLVLPVVLLGILLYSRSSLQLSSLEERLVLPSEYPHWSVAPCEFNNFTLSCAQDYSSCWYDNFPCVINGNSDIEMRGDDFRDGFRNKTIN